jgi:hypothetical protein
MFKLLFAIHNLNSLYKNKNALENLANIKKYERKLYGSFFSEFYTVVEINYTFKSKNNIIYEFQYTNPKQGTNGLYIELNDHKYFKTLLYRKTIYNCFGEYFDKLDKNIENKIIEDVNILRKEMKR